MTPERWQKIEEAFQEALEREEPDERAAFLDAACAGDSDLRREVDSLLAHQESARTLLNEAVAGAATELYQRQSQPEAERRIGPYKIVRELGRGGMGTVYLAVRDDDQYRQQVAIKLIRRGMDTDDILSRFRHERQILANLEHPHIARLLDGGTTADGLPYLVMEYIEGQALDSYCDARQLSTGERLQLFRTVCSAVHYAHQNLIVHRDLKPGNILVTADGTPKLLDFGIAKLLDPELYAQPSARTATALRPMTPDYASPEQVRGAAITTASDVYSLGVLLYELLTGHKPYRTRGTEPQEVERLICEQEPEKPSTIIGRTEQVPDALGTLRIRLTPESVSRTRGEGQPEKLRRRLAGDLDNIVLMAMRKEPSRRYSSVAQFSEDIRRHLEGLPVIARRDTFPYRAGKFIRRHRVGVAGAASFLALLTIAGVNTKIQSNQLARERDRAERERDKALQVSAFLADIFKGFDPGESKGSAVSVRDVLDRGVTRIEAELADQPEVQATLLDTIGKVYYGFQLYDRAAPLLERAFEMRRRILGEAHPETVASYASSRANMAALLFDKGDFAAAEPQAREALAIRRRLYGDEHTDSIDSLNTLAAVMYGKGDLTASEQLFREALALRRKLYGNEHPDVATYINNLGLMLYEKGDYEAAEPLLREALGLHRKLRGDEDVAVGHSLNNLALVWQERGQTSAAEGLFREALELRRRLLGEEHVLTLQSMNNLASLWCDTGDYQAAEQLSRRTLKLRREVLPEGNQNIGVTMAGLGRVLLERGEAESAAAMLREAVKILRQSLPENNRHLAVARSCLGASLGALGRDAEAEPLLITAYQNLKATRGASSRLTEQARERLVNFYADRGRTDHAARYRMG